MSFQSVPAIRCLFFAVLIFSFFFSSTAYAEALGRVWESSRRVSADEISHERLDALLKRYVDEDGYVDYSSWQSLRADRRALLIYLAEIGRAGLAEPATKEAKLALWINAYNAVTIEGILRVYPTSSIRNHTARTFGYNIWDDLPLIVGGREFSLNDIEHKILRRLSEPRIHFAIVCASVGCPRLRTEAYTMEKVNKQLTENARDFFSRQQNLRIAPRNNLLYLSSIFDWFGEDFGESRSAQLRAIRPFLPDSAKRIVDTGTARVKFLDYDWNLNDQKLKRP